MNRVRTHLIVHVVKQGDTLIKIGLRYGFKNPGPIYNHPLNKRKLRSPHQLPTGTKLIIPPTQDGLRKRKGQLIQLKSEHLKLTEDILLKSEADRAELASFSQVIDIVAGVLTLNVRSGYAAAADKSNKVLLLQGQKIAKVATASMKDYGVNQKERSKLSQYIRYATGFMNPSFIAEVAMWAKTGDKRFLTEGQNVIFDDVKRDVKSVQLRTNKILNERIAEIDRELKADYYHAYLR